MLFYPRSTRKKFWQVRLMIFQKAKMEEKEEKRRKRLQHKRILL